MRIPGGSHPAWVPWFYIAPFLLIFGIFVALPLVQSLSLSMQQTFGPRSRQFVFLDNFTHVFTDPLFWIALRNTAIFAAGSIFVQLPVSLGLAILLQFSQAALNRLERWCGESLMEVNTEKSEYILLVRTGQAAARATPEAPPVKLEYKGAALPYKKAVRFLGVTVDERKAQPELTLEADCGGELRRGRR